jgi:hypothetical protein
MVLVMRHSVLTAPASPVPPSVGLSVPPPGAGVTGASRTAYTGTTFISTPNTVISRRNITGNIEVAANNVTFSDCLINGAGGFAIQAQAGSGLVVDHCTISGLNYNNSCILTGLNFTVTNCIMTGYENAMSVQGQGGSGLIEGNYIHTLSGPPPDPHVDGIQMGDAGPGLIIRGNWIEAHNTSCIFMKTYAGIITGVTITGNTLINRPGMQTSFTLYTDQTPGPVLSNITITNNRLQRGANGYISQQGTVTGTVWSGNVDYITGASVPLA